LSPIHFDMKCSKMDYFRLEQSHVAENDKTIQILWTFSNYK